MNGVHDMGGMQDMGPIAHETNEPTFHHAWEGRLYAMTRAVRARGGSGWNLDAFRHGIEKLPPAEYLRMTYYEKWFAWMLATLVSTGTATQEEIDTGRPAAGMRSTPALTAAAAAETVDLRPTSRRDVPAKAHFKAGQRVRARNMHPVGHTRLPRYVRGKIGEVVRDRGVHVFPDSHAHDRGENPQHLYSVRFTARELWGESASPRDTVHLDMWDDYLEHA